ncbi:MAG: type II secretion system F family protein [Planctomycetota bacterium]|jgi:tight adherence protein C
MPISDVNIIELLALSATDRWMQIGLSIGAFASVFMFVVAIFSQPGDIKMSPQRQAALALGHTDRRTVFERTMMRPIMWILLVMSHRLSVPYLKRWLRSTLTAAGSPEYYTAEEYLALSMLGGLALGSVLVMFVMIVFSGQVSLFALLIGFLFGFGLTIYNIYDKAGKRIRQIAKRIPYAMDLISLAMGAGATFTEAVQTVVQEKGDEPFNVELKALLAEMDLGTTRRRALENMAERIPLDQFRSIISSVVQAEELGTPLADVLHQQANLLRLQRSVRAENAAAVASVRILVPSLLILMAVVLAVFAPMILRAISGGLY